MLNKMKIGPKLIGGFVIVAVIAAIIGVFGIVEMKIIAKADTFLYEKTAVPLGILVDYSTSFQRARINLRDMIRSNDPAAIEKYQTIIENLDKALNDKSEAYKATYIDKNDEKIWTDFLKKSDAYTLYSNEIQKLAKQNKDTEAYALLDGDALIAGKEANEELDRITELNINAAKEQAGKNTKTASSASLTMVTILSIGVIIALLLGIFLTISITRPLTQGVSMMQEMSKGHLNTRLNMNRADEIGSLAKAMDEFSEDLQKNIVATVKKIGEGDLSVVLTSKDNADEITPAIMATVNNLNGLIGEMKNMSTQHDLGDIDVSITVDKFKGAYREMGEGVNKMVFGHIAVKKKAMACIGEFGKGNFDAPLEKFPGKKVFINDTIEGVRKNLKDIAAELITLIEASKNGALSTRGNANAYQGDWQKMIKGVNEILDAILEPINEAAGVLEMVAARDMTARVKGDYKGDHAKIKISLNSAVENLDTALTQVAEATEQVSSGSQQISAGSQSLAQGANEQASSLEEVSSSLEEMASMTKQNADNANQANSLAGEANGNAAQGAEAMSRMNTSINKIKESSDQTAKIVKTIDEIAMQTNLLALNAAVEAARAGEAGRGFAVVAEEVRNLAQRSADAAKNTANMIEESVKNAEEGVKISGEVSKSFELIAESSKKVNDLIAEIAAASQEQSTGIDQVNMAVSQMDKVTQQNAANSEESASAAEEMSSQAEELQSMISQFNLTQSVQRKSTAQQVKQTHLVHNDGKKMVAPSKSGSTKKVKSTESVKSSRTTSEQMIPMDDDLSQF